MLSKDMVAAIAVVVVCLLGSGAVILGSGLSWLLRHEWSGRTAAMDAATAIGMFLACTVTVGLLGLDAARKLIWIAALALLSVVFRHLARFFAARKASGSAA